MDDEYAKADVFPSSVGIRELVSSSSLRMNKARKFVREVSRRVLANSSAMTLVMSERNIFISVF